MKKKSWSSRPWSLGIGELCEPVLCCSLGRPGRKRLRRIANWWSCDLSCRVLLFSRRSFCICGRGTSLGASRGPCLPVFRCSWSSTWWCIGLFWRGTSCQLLHNRRFNTISMENSYNFLLLLSFQSRDCLPLYFCILFQISSDQLWKCLLFWFYLHFSTFPWL